VCVCACVCVCARVCVCVCVRAFAGCMLHTIESQYGDIHDKIVADVGCGTGMLSVGCCLLGAQ